jgi:hypothetical protein
MNNSQPNKMTVVYIANTGHIVAGVSRTDSTGASPAVADLIGNTLTIRGVENNTFAGLSGTIGSFAIPQGDLRSLDVDFDLVGTYPWGRAINLPIPAPGTSGPGPPVVSSSLNPLAAPSFASGPPPSLNLTIATAQPFYIVLTQTNAMSGAIAPLSGTLVVTAGAASVALPALSPGPYLAFIFVQTMLPYVLGFQV